MDEETPDGQGQIKATEQDVWQSINHGLKVDDAVWIVGEETSQTNNYRLVVEVQNNNSVRLDSAWADADADEAIPTDWIRLVKDRGINVVGLDYARLWDKIDREQGDQFIGTLLAILVQDAWPGGAESVTRLQFMSRLSTLLVKIADNSGGA